MRYVGGDLTMVDEISRNNLAQQELDEDAPARLFGHAAESEAIKQKREEATLSDVYHR